MTYYLGIDLGTTYTSAAVWRDGRVEIASLGNRAPVIPSVLLLREDEQILTGEAATRRAATEPNRVAREFKRRMGDPTPIIVGGTPYAAPALMGRLLRWVVDHLAELEGGPAAGIVVSHPANWGAFKKDLLEQVIQVADLDDVRVTTEPEAAAIHYASQERVETGAVIAVYDLGGGTFDAAVLRKTDDGFEILGQPQGIERLGGVDFDEAVFQHVVRATDGAVEEVAPDDAAAVAAVARLRQECVEAKEALSSDTDVSIPVILPSLQTEVRLTRAEFEHLIRPALADSITSMRRALRSAGVDDDEVSAVLLVGGSSRIPLVAQLVGAELGRPVAVDAHPKHGIALGAAIVAAEAAGATATGEVTEVTPSVEEEMPAAASAADVETAPQPVVAAPAAQAPPAQASPAPAAPPPPPPVHDLPPADAGRKRPVGLLVGLGAAVIAVVVAVALLSGGGDGDDVAAEDTAATEATDGEEPGAGAEASTTTTEATTTTAAPTGPFVTIDDVALEGDRYRVNYTVANFTPLVSGDPQSLHIHFFLDPPTAPANAGTNGNPPGDWHLTDEPSSLLTKYGPADAQPGARMCSVVATPVHGVLDPASGTCADLPA